MLTEGQEQNHPYRQSPRDDHGPEGSGTCGKEVQEVKRVVVDGWDEEKALKEAVDLGLANQRVKDYALNYVKNRKK